MPGSYSLAASRICSGRKVICFSTLAGSPNALLAAQIENMLGQRKVGSAQARREGSGAALWVSLRTEAGDGGGLVTEHLSAAATPSQRSWLLPAGLY